MLDTEAMRQLALTTLDENKAIDINDIDVSSLTSLTDRIIVCSATSTRHAVALADKLVRAMREQNVRPLGVEGEDPGEWVLIDFVNIVVHIMLPSTREFYDLEKLWRTTERFRKDHEN